jgi:Uma2 family endonuclease
MSTAGTKMTVEEFLALPDDGIRRWLVDGEIREFGMTQRNRFHSRLLIRLGRFLDEWVERQARPRGYVVGGEAGVRFKWGEEESVGVDVAYIPPEVAARQTNETSIVVGVPILIVEILSPSDNQRDIADKVQIYLKAGVQHVWIVDPDLPSVRVYRPNSKFDLIDAAGALSAEPDMPGLKIDLSRVFDF